MASMNWIKVEKTTAHKPEVLGLAEILNIDPTHAFGLCVRFWFWCDDQMKSESQKFVTNVTLDCVIGHKGFADALVKVGWLRVRNGSLEVPNFDRHLSESAKKRADSVRRKQKQRENDVTDMSQKNVTNVTPHLSLNLREEQGDFEASEAFDSFWDQYPIKHGKKEARAAYEKAIARLEKKMSKQQSAEKLLAAAKDYADYLQKHPNPPATKYAQGWLNQERYESDYIELLENELARAPKTFAQLRVNGTRQAIEDFVNG